MCETNLLTGPLLFFDGDCGLCNRVVRLLMRLDRAGRLRFGPLQGLTAQTYLKAKGLPTQDFSSLVFVPSWQDRSTQAPLMKTDGVKAALALCGGWGRFFSGLLGLFPRVVRDGGYSLVARSRYAVFGEWTPRPFRDPDWQQRMVD